MHSTPSPSISTHPMEVGSYSMHTQILKAPRFVEFTHTYEKGNKYIFSPESIKIVSTLDTITDQREIERNYSCIRLNHHCTNIMNKHP